MVVRKASSGPVITAGRTIKAPGSTVFTAISPRPRAPSWYGMSNSLSQRAVHYGDGFGDTRHPGAKAAGDALNCANMLLRLLSVADGVATSPKGNSSRTRSVTWPDQSISRRLAPIGVRQYRANPRSFSHRLGSS